MIVLGLLMGLVGTDVNSGVARYSFDIPELTDGIGFITIAMGVFGYGEIISNLSKSSEHREVFTGKVKGLFPTKEDFRNMIPAVLRGTALGSCAGHPARRRRAAGGLRRLHGGEEDQAAPRRSAVRQGQHPRRRGAGVGQQRRLADLLHPAADAGHSAQRRDGADGGRHDHPQHPAGPAGDDQQPAAVLGPDRLDVAGQPDAGDPEPAADRHVDQAADRALPLAVPGHRAVLRHRRVLHQQQHLRRVDGGHLRLRRLPVHQAGVPSPRRCCWASSWGR